MNKYYITPQEFAYRANISPQAVYKQMSGRLSPYVKKVKGKRKIDAEALKEFYGVVYQPESTESVFFEPNSTNIQPESTENLHSEPTESNSESTENNSESTEKQLKTELEKRINELENSLQQLIEENKEDKKFYIEQIRQKDETIKDLTDSLKMAQQLHAADKKKLLEIEQKQQANESETETIITPAVEQETQEDQTAAETAQENRTIRKFFKRIFG